MSTNWSIRGSLLNSVLCWSRALVQVAKRRLLGDFQVPGCEPRHTVLGIPA